MTSKKPYKKPKSYLPQEVAADKTQRFNKAVKYVEQGYTQKQALEKVHMSGETFRKIRKEHERNGKQILTPVYKEGKTGKAVRSGYKAHSVNIPHMLPDGTTIRLDVYPTQATLESDYWNCVQRFKNHPDRLEIRHHKLICYDTKANGKKKIAQYVVDIHGKKHELVTDTRIINFWLRRLSAEELADFNEEFYPVEESEAA
jgi:hypothetical protein